MSEAKRASALTSLMHRLRRLDLRQLDAMVETLRTITEALRERRLEVLAAAERPRPEFYVAKGHPYWPVRIGGEGPRFHLVRPVVGAMCGERCRRWNKARPTTLADFIAGKAGTPVCRGCREAASMIRRKRVRTEAKSA